MTSKNISSLSLIYEADCTSFSLNHNYMLSAVERNFQSTARKR